MVQNHGLGRGLSSLIPQKQNKDKIIEPKEDYNYFGSSVGAKASIPPKNNGIQEADIDLISPNPHQPRLLLDETKLRELAASIKEHGVIQPLVVTQNGNQFEIIAGERRFQASKIAGLKSVPVIVRKADEQQKLELAVVENIQRHDLNPIEEAMSYKRLVEDFDLSQEEVALRVGKSRSSVTNKLRLLALPVEIQKAIIEGKITEGHAKAILAIDNPEKQRALYESILKNNLTVRQVEDKTKEISVRTHKRNITVNPEVKRIEDEISQKLGTKVRVSKSGSGGKIIIEYYSEEEFGNIISRIL